MRLPCVLELSTACIKNPAMLLVAPLPSGLYRDCKLTSGIFEKLQFTLGGQGVINEPVDLVAS